MAYCENEARRLVIEAGHRLVSSGLIARTWGNISARISDTQFIITPSGRSYDNLRPEELVKVNIADCSYDGEIKPSSEKGIHADGYALRPDVDFIIHTHQFYATAVGAKGKAVKTPFIPCAGYGLPSTGMLRKAVAKAVAENPQSSAVLMMRHGALCLGRDYEDAFGIAARLENDCGKVYDSKMKPLTAVSAADMGSSVRHGDGFELELFGKTESFSIEDLPETCPKAARIHAAIYRAYDVNNILHCADGEVVEISQKGKTLRPVIDDLAQIAGVTIPCVESEPEDIAAALKGRAAVLVKDRGALCVGRDFDDAEAVCMILRKDCAAARYIKSLRGMLLPDAALQRFIYVSKYSKKKG